MAHLERILVCGGGIAGLTLAAALGRRGLNAEVIERNPAWEALGAGIAVQPNAMRVAKKLGIESDIVQRGALIDRWQIRDQSGDLLADIDLKALWGEVGAFIGIERGMLLEALRSGAANASCRLGSWLSSMLQEAGSVSVTFNDGTAAEYDLVVGADGLHSSVRQLAISGAEPVYGGQMVWRSLAPLPGKATNSVEFWLGDGCFFGLCPVAGRLVYGFGNVTTARLHDPIEGRVERLRRRFAGFAGPVQDYLAALKHDEQIHCSPIEWLELDRWYSGRVILIGDAAHASSPMMAQGGAMAMEDGLVLAEMLCAHSTVEAALDAFVSRRQARVSWVQQQSRATAQMLDIPPAVRNQVIREHGERPFYSRFGPLTELP